MGKVARSVQVARSQERHAKKDDVLSAISMFFKHQVLGPLPQDPRPLWKVFSEASRAANQAYVTFLGALEAGAPESETDALWDIYQASVFEMVDAEEEYFDAMDGFDAWDRSR